MWLRETAINDNDDDDDDGGGGGGFSFFFVFEMYLLALSLGGSNLEPHKDRDIYLQASLLQRREGYKKAVVVMLS